MKVIAEFEFACALSALIAERGHYSQQDRLYLWWSYSMTKSIWQESQHAFI
jgi:hypothetical protein